MSMQRKGDGFQFWLKRREWRRMPDREREFRSICMRVVCIVGVLGCCFLCVCVCVCWCISVSCACVPLHVYVCVICVLIVVCVISTCRAVQCDTGRVSLQRSAKPACHTTPCNCELFPALPFLFSFIRGTYARWANSPQSRYLLNSDNTEKNQHCMKCIYRAIQLV